MKMLLKKKGRATVMAAAAAASALLVSNALASTASYNGVSYDQNFNSLPDPGASDPVLGSSSIQAGNPFTYTPTMTVYNLPAPGNPNYTYGAYDFATPQSSSASAPGGLGLGAANQMPGWYAFGVNNNNFGAQSGDKTVGGIISFGADGTAGSDHTNRALGTIGTKESGLTTFGLELVNNSGGSLNQINLSFLGELWRQDSTQKSLNIGYKLGGTTLPLSGTTAIPAAQLSFASGNLGDPAVAGVSAPIQTSNISSGNINLSSAWGQGQALWLTFGISDASANGQGIAIDNFHFTAANISLAPTPTWNTTSGIWDNTTSNWINGSPNVSLYKEGDAPVFGNISADSTITVANVAGGGVTPSNVTISNAAHTYTFTGGSINGAASLTKSGAGTVVLNSPNGYTGGTFVNGGTLIVDGGDTRLGTVPAAGAATESVNLANGTLKVQTTALTSGRQFNVFAGGGTIDTNGLGVTISGTTTVADVLTKVGAGNLEFDGALNFQSGNGGTLNIAQGNVIFGQAAGKTVTQINSSTYNGNIIVKNGIRLNFSSGTSNLTGVNGTSIYGGTGNIQIQSSLVGISNLSSTFGGTINLPIVLNSLNLAFTKLDVTQPIGTGGATGTDPVSNPNGLGPVFTTTIGGTSNHTDIFTPPGIPTQLVFGAVISGASDVQIGNGQTGGGSGNTVFLAQNTYTGATIVNAGTSTIVIGIDNALPTGTDVIFGTNAGTKTPIIDLSGHNQQVNSLSTGGGLAGITSVNPGNYTVTNMGVANSVFTISGATTPYTGWGGVISDASPANGGTSGTLQLVKGGSSTLVLSGPNTYQGGTVINGGTLRIDPALGGNALPTSTPVTNNANFIVNAGFTTAGTIDGNGATTVNSGAGLTATHIRQGSLVANANVVISQTPTAGDSAATSVLSSLTLAGSPGAWTSSLDLGNNGLVLNYSGGSPLALVADQTRHGGIISSLADASHAIGFGEASDIVGPTGGAFLGQTITAGQTAVLARYTLIGDANLDGHVDFNDFLTLQRNFGHADVSWAHGNFVGDPTIDFNDFLALQRNFGHVVLTSQQAAEVAAFAANPSAAVPEPASLALAGFGALGLLARRRRNA
jgi:fibronectin-binding autotransporter adhesin